MLNCSRQCSGTAHRRAMSLVLLCLFLMTLCLGFAAPSLAAGTAAAARQCIVQAGKAVDSADTAAFEKLVDMDGILAAALDIFVRRAKQPQAAAELPPMLAILFSQAASGEQGSAISQGETDMQHPLYRIPYQVSMDGNTAELSVEQSKFASNATDFQTSLTFLNMKITGIAKAIEGR